MGFAAVEVAGGLLSHSLALLADAAHMLTDTGSVGLALLAGLFARRPANARKTYGYYRIEILAALTNSTVLLLMAFFILAEAFNRFQNPPEIKTGPMLLIAILGLSVNLLCMKILSPMARGNLNVRGAYLEVMSDMLASLGVIAAGVLIQFTGWRIIDPFVSGAIGLFILPRTWSLLNEAAHILLEGAPAHIDLLKVSEAIKNVPSVQAVHDLHVWTITSGSDALSAHIVIADRGDGDRVLADLRKILGGQFGLWHTTIQLEVELCGSEGCYA